MASPFMPEWYACVDQRAFIDQKPIPSPLPPMIRSFSQDPPGRKIKIGESPELYVASLLSGNVIPIFALNSLVALSSLTKFSTYFV